MNAKPCRECSHDALNINLCADALVAYSYTDLNQETNKAKNHTATTYLVWVLIIASLCNRRDARFLLWIECFIIISAGLQAGFAPMLKIIYWWEENCDSPTIKHIQITKFLNEKNKNGFVDRHFVFNLKALHFTPSCLITRLQKNQTN